MRLTLASYNIHRCYGHDGIYNPARIIRVLHELDADIVALQEVQSDSAHPVSLLERLAAETGLQAVAGPTLLKATAAYGNALLTRLNVSEVRRYDLSLPRREPRGALDVELEHAAGRLQVVVTHFGLNGRERRVQTRRLLGALAPTIRHPIVVLGDINEWFPWARALRWLHTRFGKAPARATFPATCPTFALDRIWVSPPDRLVNFQVHASPLARLASDHLPVKAVLQC